MRYALLAVLLAAPATIGAQPKQDTEPASGAPVLTRDKNQLVYRLGRVKRRLRFAHRILEMRPHPSLPFAAVSTTRDPEGAAFQRVDDVFVVDLARGRRRSIRTRRSSCDSHRSCPLPTDPWSPDGQRLALVSDLNGGVKVFDMRRLRRWIRTGRPRPKRLTWRSETGPKQVEPAKFYSVSRWLRPDRLAFAADCCGTNNTVVYDFSTRRTKLLGICSEVPRADPGGRCRKKVRDLMKALSKP